METFQWLRDVLRSPRGTPSTSPRAVSPTTPRSTPADTEGEVSSGRTPATAPATAKCPVEDKAPAEIQRWEVVWSSGVHVRRTKDRTFESIGIRARGTAVFGREEDGWVALSDEPGFMFISDGECTLMQKTANAPDLDAMMLAAEARRVDVEAQATRLMELLSGVSSTKAGQHDSSKNVPAVCAEPGSPLSAPSIWPSGSLPEGLAVETECDTAIVQATESAARMESYAAELEQRLTSIEQCTPRYVAATVAAVPEVPDSPLQSAVQSPRVPEPVLPPPTLSLPTTGVFRRQPQTPDSNKGPSQASSSVAAGILAPPWRPTSTLRSRSGPPSRQQPDLASRRGEGQLALATSGGPGAEQFVRQRLGEAKGKVDEVMDNMSDVRSRLGAQEGRLSSLTRSLRDLSEGPPSVADAGERGRLQNAGEQQDGGSRAASSSLRPEVRTLFSSMVEEMQHISELAARGEEASREVEEVKVHLETLCIETDALGLTNGPQPSAAVSNDQCRELLLIFRRELSDALHNLRCQDLGSLRHDMDALKEELRSFAAAADMGKQARGTKIDPADERLSLLSSDVTALRGVLADTVGTLRTELCSLAGQAIEGVSQVSRQDLDDGLLQIRQDMAETLSAAVDALREETNLVALTDRGSPTEAASNLNATLADLRARLDKTAGDAVDARRGLDSLQEDLALLQTSKMVTQQELGKTTEFLSKEFRLLLDMTMHNFHSTTRQELAQTSSQLRRELRPLADFGANEEGAATRRELAEAVDQLRQEMEPPKTGRDGTPEGTDRWRDLVSVVENLLEDVAQLGEKTSRGEQAAAAELAEERRRLTGLVEDVGILKAQRRLQGEEARLEKDDLEQLILSQQQRGLEGLREEVKALMCQDMSRLSDWASKEQALSGLKGSPGRDGARAVTRRELEDAADSIRQELAVMLNGSNQSGNSVTRHELADLVDSMMSEVTRKIQAIATTNSSAVDNVELAETQQMLVRLGEDVAFLKIRHGIMGEEASQEKEAMEQRVRSVRQELTVAIEEIRTRLPAAASLGSPNRPGSSPGSSAFPDSSPTGRSSPSSSRPPAAHVGLLGRGELLDTEKDFGNLRDDLNSLKNRQEFLKQELKCLVDTASRS